MSRWLSLPLLLLALLIPASAFAELDVSDARIKNLPPTVPVRAGYMTLHNPGPQSVTIAAVQSDAFASVEIHRSYMQDGMMRMDQVDGLTIEPGATVRLAPGGLHLMMMQPAEATKPGDSIEIVLKFDDGTGQRLTLEVVE
jgi:copper(I)-binding protein